jgi:ubiquitin-conjugating enzyme E2 J1
MSTRGQFNTKNPTIKRICKLASFPLSPLSPTRRAQPADLPVVKEASELSASPSSDYHAEPLETNLFEWHFTIRGPPAPSAYAGGLYHGRIILPPQYPLRPPAFRFLTPTGRFEVNREICLSISGHHEETWQPAWGVRTALVAIRSFMDTDAKGQLGGIECTKEAREKMAKESHVWKCSSCAKSNSDIINEREELVRSIQSDQDQPREEEIPQELRLAYRDQLGNKGENPVGSLIENATNIDTLPQPLPSLPSPSAAIPVPPTSSAASTRPLRIRHTPLVQQPAQPNTDRSLALVDTFIYGIVAALLFMVLKRFA